MAARSSTNKRPARAKKRKASTKPARKTPARTSPYQTIVDSLGEGFVTTTLDGRVRHCNPVGLKMFGCRLAQIAGRELSECIFDESRPGEDSAKLLARIATKKGAVIRGLKGRRRGGEIFPIEVTGTRMTLGEGPLFVIIVRDVSRYTEDLVSLRRAAVVFEATTEGIMILSLDWRVEAVNRAYSEITGHSETEVVGRPPPFLTARGAAPDLAAVIAKSVRTAGRWDDDPRAQRKNGEFYSERLTVSAVRDEQAEIVGYVAILADVTQRRQDEERVRYQANYDSLTGLPNRSLFMDRLTQAVNTAERSAHRVAVMFIDLDGFKLVNDTLGHEVGDELLREAARRLSANIRAGDTVARIGGDEFTVVMPALVDSHPAPVVAQRIITSLEQPFRFNRQEAMVSASIGITVFPDDARDVQALLRNADAAMYQAKEQGKANYQFYTADLNAQATERLAMKNGLVKALRRNELQLDFQPRRELASGRVTGVEALLRWNSRDLGPVPPSKFIPVAEETGAIGPIGEWVLGVACDRERSWRAEGIHDVRVAINLSGRQLRQPNIVSIIAARIERAGVTPDGLEIEITESMVMRDADHSAATLRSLAAMGIRIILDDFGTGNSSLSVLKRFPVDMIKIDQTLVGPINTDQESLEIVRAIVSMGHSLRRRVIAEGVETEDQARRLAELQCDEIQGYLVSPPIAADEIDRFVAASRRAIPA